MSEIDMNANETISSGFGGIPLAPRNHLQEREGTC